MCETISHDQFLKIHNLEKQLDESVNELTAQTEKVMAIKPLLAQLEDDK